MAHFQTNPLVRTITTELRVRYADCDPMGVAHHAVYPVWFELGRTELLRAAGISYRELEQDGMLLAVVALAVRYRRPARYDDLLMLTTTLKHTTPARIEHAYEIHRAGDLLTTATTTLAHVDRHGNLQRIPSWLMLCSTDS